MGTHNMIHAPDPDPKILRALRHGQSMASAFVAESLALLTWLHPELWTNENFLLILSKAYEHLALGRAVEPGEYFTLIRTLVGSGRLKSPGTQKHNTGDEETARGSKKESLGAEVRRLMQQVYGVNLQFNNDDAPPVGHATTKPSNETASRQGDVHSKS